MQLQGKVYGKYMHKAEVFDGLKKFLAVAKIRKSKIYIVSHKTKYGHFDNDKIPLRIEAMKWLKKKKLLEINIL